jgi:predicted AlkP superfamily pyrophosphatase or phosphodiesterase
MDNTFVEPRYDAGGFANLPAHLVDLFNARKYDAVVLFLVDGFGWRFFDKFQDAPFLQLVTRENPAARLVSQFPSTTAAHLTTLHSAMPVGQHGIFEWIYYEPIVDAMIAPLLFSYSGTAERDTLKPSGARPRSLLPKTTFYHLLKKMGVYSTILQHREYTPSTYGNILFSGATVRSYKTLPEVLVNLTQMLKTSRSPAYFVLYYDKVDAVSHEYGPQAPQTEAEILMFLLTMEKIFLKSLDADHKKVLFLLTADHGHIETDPLTTIYLNRDPRFEGVEKYLRADMQGKLLVPAGSARDFFLYIKDGMVDEALAFLSSRLAGKAEVRKVEELIAAGYFGPAISPAFRGHTGDLVILPYASESVWWFEKDKFEQRFRGHHGGLTKQEMEIPLLMWEI